MLIFKKKTELCQVNNLMMNLKILEKSRKGKI